MLSLECKLNILRFLITNAASAIYSQRHIHQLCHYMKDSFSAMCYVAAFRQ